METTYRITAGAAMGWEATNREERARWRIRLREKAKALAAKRGASVVTIETPAGLIVDTLEVA